MARVPRRARPHRPRLHGHRVAISAIASHELPGIVATIAGRAPDALRLGLATTSSPLVVLALAPGRIRALAAVWAALLGAGLTVSYLATSLEPGARLTSNAERTTLQLVLGLLCLAALALRRRRDSA